MAASLPITRISRAHTQPQTHTHTHTHTRQIQELEEEKRQLEQSILELKAKCESIEKREGERRAMEERKHSEEIAFLKKTNVQLKVGVGVPYVCLACVCVACVWHVCEGGMRILPPGAGPAHHCSCPIAAHLATLWQPRAPRQTQLEGILSPSKK
jgi:hypothetical protein